MSRKFSDENQQRAVAGTSPTYIKPARPFLRLDLLTAFTYLINNLYHVDRLLIIVVKEGGQFDFIAEYDP
ncbi:hypothetical protein D4S03_06640 [bacterium]|nr:MAG: hypothetical protein D4S03_06640 [bacterium]